ncbi:hypothetical protein [Acidisphaera sp. S103]|uniref:hypothetical protein n=1 Tax=Acidisphaera sp. S103 TaxID=1747223 RepID=UPI00131DFE69|nr:hypothetical protein [Acidisphaera sp. S103]
MPMQIGIHAFTCENKDMDGGPSPTMTVARRCRKINISGYRYELAASGALRRPRFGLRS